MGVKYGPIIAKIIIKIIPISPTIDILFFFKATPCILPICQAWPEHFMFLFFICNKFKFIFIYATHYFAPFSNLIRGSINAYAYIHE